ncbi:MULTISPECIES: hypothetical protein [unclassified Acinetobacter]|uniref:hypothetical protein n=2 Tax=unclassified Acinetobacter TaxID=196816 RepID=UPI0025C0BFA0|nr:MULTISPECIES: hypothetical protein [unclassified Acinetobacter]
MVKHYENRFFILGLCMISFLFAAQYSFAGDLCSNKAQLEKLLRQQKIIGSFDSNYLSCKSLPQSPELSLVAYTKWIASKEDETIGVYQLTFLTLETKTNTVQSKYVVQQSLISDAISLDSISLDLGAYKVSQTVRAIGLRLNYSGHSQPNPYRMQLLNLYDLNNKTMILDGLIVERYRAETDTQCNAEIEERNSTLVMLPKKSHQYSDIQVRSKISHYEMSGTLEHCVEGKRNRAQQSFILKFDGTQYQVPQAFAEDYRY